MSRRRTSVALKQALWQTPLLLAAACLLAMVVSSLQTDGIPLVGDWSDEARYNTTKEERLIIDLATAKHLFETGGALFVDARPVSQYAQEHIRGAICLPWQQVDDYLMNVFDRLESAETIIAYCDGEHCDLSHELTFFLKELGFENVRVLVNGLTVWQQAGLPIETGG